MSLNLCADIVKITLNGSTPAFNWSAYACLCQQLTARKKGNLTSFENHFRDNLILNMLS